MNYTKQLEAVLYRIDKNMEEILSPNIFGSDVNGIYTNREQSLFDSGHWTFSFHTGMVFLAFVYTGDTKYLKYINRFEEAYSAKVYKHTMDTMHDLGFLYTLYSVAHFVTTGDLKARETALKAADELGKRFNINCRAISAWGRMDKGQGLGAGLAIADCMMNLPLLFWAWMETGHFFYRDVAIAHADTTIKYFVRDDNSICHAYKFDPDSGLPEQEMNWCGYGVGSAWARGTTWAIYGFAIAYRYTQKEEYLETAKRLMEFYLSQLPEDMVPVWDFRLHDNMEKKRDTSAAAIAACSLLELSEHVSEGSERYKELAARMIKSLSSPVYCALKDDVQAVLWTDLFESKRNACIYGDYFYTEALMRLGAAIKGFW